MSLFNFPRASLDVPGVGTCADYYCKVIRAHDHGVLAGGVEILLHVEGV